MNNQIRALHVYRTYFPDPPGGMQEAIRQLCLATQSHGVENTIFTLSPTPQPNEIIRPEGRVVRARSLAAPASCDLGGFDAIQKFKALTADSTIVHYLFPWPYADFLHAVTNPSIPAVLTYVSDVIRQQWLSKAYAPLMWRTLKNVKAIVANCPTYIETSPILSHPSIRDKIRVIPLGIAEKSYPKRGDESVFTRIGHHPDEPYFLFIGVLRYYKGLDTLIQASQYINARVIIAGSGPEEARLHKMIETDKRENIIFAGNISDEEKVALLKHCRALVLPSHLRSEAFGMVLVEAAMFGRPLISCEIGTGTSYINAHGETGFVVSPGNTGELVNAMKTLLKDDLLVQHFGKGARSRYERLFSGPALGKAYSELFEELVRQG